MTQGKKEEETATVVKEQGVWMLFPTLFKSLAVATAEDIFASI